MENNMKLTQIISFYHKKTISIVKRNDFEAVNIVFFNCGKARFIPARDHSLLLRPIAAEYPLGHKLIGCLYVYMQPGRLFFHVYMYGLCLHYAWHVQINGPFILSSTQVALSLPYETRIWKMADGHREVHRDRCDTDHCVWRDTRKVGDLCRWLVSNSSNAPFRASAGKG